MRNMGENIGNAEVDTIMRLVDKDGDGSISFEGEISMVVTFHHSL